MYQMQNNDYLHGFRRVNGNDRDATATTWLHIGESATAAGTNIPRATAQNEMVLQPVPSLVQPTPTWFSSYDKNVNYTARFNDWAYAHDLVFERQTTQQRMQGGYRIWECKRRIHVSDRCVEAYGSGTSKKIATTMADYVLYEMLCTKVQMEGEASKESDQGLTIQESDKANNTIVTRDELKVETKPIGEEDVGIFASSESLVTMDQITNRWIPLRTLSVRTTDKFEGIIQAYFIPETIFGEISGSVNLLPFETFLYSDLNVDFKFLVNGNKFQCGKVIASVKFDSYQAENHHVSIQAALSRPHVILDLASNNEGELHVPFRYHRALMRNVKNDTQSIGVRPSKYATVVVSILSPLTTGKDGATDMNIRPYIRFTKARFAGMSYRVAVQMEMAEEALKLALPSSELKGVLCGAEKLMKAIGNTQNRDKPTDIIAHNYVPHARMNFGTGKGLIDAQPLRNDPTAMTSYSAIQPYKDEPRTTLEIAQIWGLRNKFTWKNNQKTGSQLLNIRVDPTSRNYTAGYDGAPTPLEYVCGMYNFWAGTIEVRLDFVSNSFHTGAIMLSAEYGRPATSELEKSSTYTKTFHLGEQKTVNFTIPFISDTVWKRSTGLVYQNRLERPAATDAMRDQSLSIRPETKMSFKVTVINELRPVSTAPQEIEVLLFWRATPSFMVHGLKQMSYNHTFGDADLKRMDNFPANGYQAATKAAPEGEKPKGTDGERSKREVKPDDLTTMKPVIKPHQFRYPLLDNGWGELDAKYLGKVKTQMDQGEDDDDPTEDFRVGRFNLGVQTNDAQVSIKDIMRRPVLMVFNTKLELSKGSFLLPLMPPSREMQWLKDGNSIFSAMIGQTPQAAIVNLFRFWRGGMRYTIIISGGNSSIPTYVTAIPHSGVRYLGFYPHDITRPIGGVGLATEMILPSVNPSAVIEAPYDTENNWTLSFEDNANLNYSWRDKGDTNAGHIAIWGTQDVTATIWWSGADDFELTNFYGIPWSTNDDYAYQWNDHYARVQMDFQSNDRSYLGKTISFVKNAALPAALGAVPVVGSSLAMGYGAYKAAEVVDRAEQVMRKWSDVGTETEKSIQIVTPLITDMHSQVTTLLEKITGMFGYVPKVVDIIRDAIMDIVAAWLSKSWIVVGVGIVKIISKVVDFDLTNIMEWGLKIGEIVKKLFSPEVVVVQVQPNVDPTGSYLGVLASLVGTVFHCTINPVLNRTERGILSYLTSAGCASYLNNMFRFVQATFEIVKTFVMRALGYVDPEVTVLRRLCDSPGMLNDFVVSAQLCLNEANTGMMLAPGFRTKFWHTVMRAYQIQRVMTILPGNLATPQLARLCSDVIKAATERFVDLSCSPVRYEPYVICIQGEPGIGKSFMTHHLVKTMLERVGFNRPTSGLTYDRVPGSKFWSGYRDQPAVVYDDWLNLNDSQQMIAQISELYQLKSVSRFIPEMAHLEEKRISANPMIVVLCCNDAFPNSIANVALHTDAVFRRRDLCMQVELKPEFHGQNLRDVLDGQGDLSHLTFRIWHDSKEEISLSHRAVEWEQFQPWFLQNYERYHAQERLNVRQRVTELQAFLQGAEAPPLGDPFEFLYTAQLAVAPVNQNAWLPSEQLEQAVLTLVNTVQQEHVPVEIIVPEAAHNIFVQSNWSFLMRCLKIGGAILLTPSCIAEVMKWTWNQLTEFLTEIEWQALDTNAFPVEMCVICHDDKPCAYKCHNHYVCVDCRERNLNTNDTTACPLCRTETLTVTLGAGASLWYIAASWLAKNMNMLRPFVSWVCRFMKSMPVRMCATISLIAQAVNFVLCPILFDPEVALTDVGRIAVDTVFRPDVNLTDEILENPVTAASTATLLAGPAMLVRGMTGRRIAVQMDGPDPWGGNSWRPLPTPNEPIATTSPMNPLNQKTFRSDLLADYCLTIKPSPFCMHHELLEQVNSAAFERTQNGPKWRIYGMVEERSQHIYLDDGPCCDECPFADAEIVEPFMKRWESLNHQWVINKVVGAFNGTQPLNIFRNSLPKLVQPVWMDAPQAELEKEWWEYLSEQYDKYKTLIRVCMGVASVATGLLAAYKIFNYFSGNNNTIAQGDMNYNGAETRFQRARANPARVRMERVRVQAETLMATVDEAIARNYVMMKVWRGEEVVKRMTLVGITGMWAMMPAHYLNYLSTLTDPELTLEPAMYINGNENHMRTKYAFDRKDFKIVEGLDLVFFKLPKSCPNFRKITKFFQTDADLASYMSNHGHIVLAPTKARTMIGYKDLDIYGVVPSVFMENVDGSSFWSRDLLKYNHSEAGACGSLVLTDGTQRPIRAMHVGGSSGNTGFGVLITQELIEEILPSEVQLEYEVRMAEYVEPNGNEHDHKCKSCGKWYRHEHPFSKHNHRQFDKQCPNPECEQYWGKYFDENEKNAVLLDKPEDETTPILEPLSSRNDTIMWEGDVKVDYLGVIPPGRDVHTPTKSKIIPSVIQGLTPELEPKTFPGILTKKDPRYKHAESPLYYGAKKHGKVTIDLPQSQVRRAREAVWDVYYAGLKPNVVQPKRLSIEQAVMGLPGIDYCDPIKLNTSAGYPWQTLSSDTSKEAWIQTERNAQGDFIKCEIHAKLRAEIERKENLRKKGVIPMTMFVDTLKDERRAQAKLEKEGGTRVFCASPVDYTIAMRQNFLHFTSAFMKTRLEAGHAVGLNAKGTEWTDLFEKIVNNNPKNILEIDYSNFGPGYNALVSEAAGEIFIRWTLRHVEGVDETELRACIHECINSVHIAESTVYRQFSGSPSGATITTIINSIVNQIYMMLAWIALIELSDFDIYKFAPDVVALYKKMIVLITYGDDLIGSVREEVAHIFNMNTITKWFAQYGIAATSASDKTAEVLPDFVTITDAQFLKRRFRKHPERRGLMLGPLDAKSLEDIPLWIWSCADHRAATRINADSALMEAHAHGRQYFEEFKTRLNDALTQQKIEALTMTWDTLDNLWFEGDLELISNRYLA